MEEQTSTGFSISATTNPNLTPPQQQQLFQHQILLQQQNHQFHPQRQMQQQMMQKQTQANLGKQQHRAGNPVEAELVQQDIEHVLNPDIERPFESIEDAVNRLLPYHVVADFEDEDDESGRLQQWDQIVQAKVGEYTDMFEKQVQSFNHMCRSMKELKSEEGLMMEQAMLQEEKQEFVRSKHVQSFNQMCRSMKEFKSEERLMMEQAMLQEEKQELVRLKAERIRSQTAQNMQMMNQVATPGTMRLGAFGLHGDDMIGSWGSGSVGNWGEHQ